MYNQNNLWPTISPLGPYGYATRPPNPMPTNSNVFQQNMNQLSYYNPNPGFGQQLNSGYNYYVSPIITQSNQTIGYPYLTSNQSFLGNTSTQSYPSSNLRPIPTVTTIQTTDYNTPNNGDNKWLELLNDSQKQVLDQLNKETEAFEQQFKNWEKDFENWKQVNRCHPDSSAYQLYSNQWQEWRQKLLERQQLMKDLRTRTLQQLYIQVKPQITELSFRPPLPPLPPPPEKREIRPPLPPPEPNPSPQKRTENYRNESNLIVICEEMQTNGSKKLKTSQNSKSENKDIEVIEIDCEPKRCEKNKSAETADPTAVSKAAEALLFIQKQQELLKTLENLKSVKTGDKARDKCGDSSEELQIIEPKPFDVKDIVTKMQAIRPPENAIEANKFLSTLPSLQGIVFQPKSNPHNNKQIDSRDGSFGDIDNRPPFAQNNRNSFPQMSTIRPGFQSNPGVSQPLRGHLSNDSINSRHPMPRIPTINNKSNFMQTDDSRWKSPNTEPNTSHEGQHYYRVNEKPSPQYSNCKYLAQTIDYNHRHENNDSDQRIEPSVETPVKWSPTKMVNFASSGVSTPMNNNLFPQTNANHSFNREAFDEFRNPINSSNVVPNEEPLTYRDIRYFTQPKSRIVPIDDLLRSPTRDFRPENIVIILRGFPGSGKTFFAKLIKEKEMEFGSSAPRILSIDDYFMAEIERQVKAPETGKMVNTKEYVYEYEREMESCYRASLLKTYKKTVDDRLFSFIIIDAVNELIADIEDFYSYAIKNDFTVYVIEMVSTDPLVCHKNNIHNRTLEDIKLIHKKWQTLPDFMLRLDIRSLLQNASIKNVEMEVNSSESEDTLKRKAETEATKEFKSLRDSEDQSFNGETPVSRWERMEASESKLDKLDSFRMKTKPTIEEYLQVSDDYDFRIEDKKRRVRWADIEEKKKQDQMRQRGFVVGLDWHQYMDPQHPQRVLTETKYF